MAANSRGTARSVPSRRYVRVHAPQPTRSTACNARLTSPRLTTCARRNSPRSRADWTHGI